jgi:hypothetical protein
LEHERSCSLESRGARFLHSRLGPKAMKMPVTSRARIGPLIIVETLVFMQLEVLGMEIGRNKMHRMESNGPSRSRSKT